MYNVKVNTKAEGIALTGAVSFLRLFGIYLEKRWHRVSEGKNVGRPLKFASLYDLQTKIAQYYMDCDEKGHPYTISGLAVALGTNRQTLLNYEEKDEFIDTIKEAKARIEAFNERMLYSKDVPTTGVIFNLKNNYGWKDTQEIEAKVDSKVNINIELSDE